ncbi:hypothetical protein PR048_019090 [Dryococelus australis]|uniref:MADF domain-containing protein n=1 Tax=Dryococelus australis TaxID=614101 RepID=A0ABQ9H2M1_9NEOP|nr:hypothetical protein PR048_019090 [Dryococelus australis]
MEDVKSKREGKGVGDKRENKGQEEYEETKGPQPLMWYAQFPTTLSLISSQDLILRVAQISSLTNSHLHHKISRLAAVAFSTPPPTLCPWARPSSPFLSAVATILHSPCAHCGGKGKIRGAVAGGRSPSAEDLVFPAVHIFDIQNNEYPDFVGHKIRTCFQSIEPIALGKFHLTEKFSALSNHDYIVGSEDTCKTKWKNLRDWYNPKEKDGKLPTGSGAASVRIRTRFDQMSFFDGISDSRRRELVFQRLSNIAHDEEEDEPPSLNDEELANPEQENTNATVPSSSRKSNSARKSTLKSPERKKNQHRSATITLPASTSVSNNKTFNVFISTKANRVQSPAGSPDFRKWESCRAMPLFGGFSRGSPVSPAPSFRRRSIFTSITLIGSEDLDSKCRPNLFTLFPRLELRLRNKTGARVQHRPSEQAEEATKEDTMIGRPAIHAIQEHAFPQHFLLGSANDEALGNISFDLGAGGAGSGARPYSVALLVRITARACASQQLTVGAFILSAPDCRRIASGENNVNVRERSSGRENATREPKHR